MQQCGRRQDDASSPMQDFECVVGERLMEQPREDLVQEKKGKNGVENLQYRVSFHGISFQTL